MVVAIFVSLPFTTYAILSGLQGIPGDVYEAAAIDGATSWRSYLRVTLPLLRPAILVATLINVINVFNSFPIIWEMTRGGPGYETATTHHLHDRPQAGRRRRVGVHVGHQLPAGHRHRPRLPRAPPAGRSRSTDDHHDQARTAAQRHAPGPRARAGGRCAPGSSPVAAYVIAIIFLLPYLEMLIMAAAAEQRARPGRLSSRSTSTFSNFTTLWSTRPRRQHRHQPGDRRPAPPCSCCSSPCPPPTAPRAAGSAAAALFLLLVLATQMFQPAAMLVGIQREFTNFGLPPDAVADHRQRRLQPRLRGLDPQRLLLLDPGRARGGGHGRRPRPGRRPAADHAAAGRAGHRDRADLHLHRAPGTSSWSRSRSASGSRRRSSR